MAAHWTLPSLPQCQGAGVIPPILSLCQACPPPPSPDHLPLYPIQSPLPLAQPPGTPALTWVTPRTGWVRSLLGQKWDLTSHLATTCTAWEVATTPTYPHMATAQVVKDRARLLCRHSCHPDQAGHPHWLGSTHPGETVSWSSWPAWSCSCSSCWS